MQVGEQDVEPRHSPAQREAEGADPGAGVEDHVVPSDSVTCTHEVLPP